MIAIWAAGGLFVPFVTKINHLADVVLHVGGALHDHVKPIERVGADAGIVGGPVLGRLRVDGSDDDRDGVVEVVESLIFRRRIRVVELARAIADIAGLRDLRADVVIQIACEVKDQVAEAVSVREGLLPELGFGKRRRQFVDSFCV